MRKQEAHHSSLRYLVHFGVENIVPDESNAKPRRICISNFTMRTIPITKDSGQIENRQIKAVDHVVQRPRATLSSPDNDYLIGKMNEKAFNRVSAPKTSASGRDNLVRVDVGNARVRVRGTNPPFGVQDRPRIKDYSRPSGLKNKTCVTKLKS
ncbi:hypothetical protein L2E82_20184 [Cichorium intybus]|uniref:Uncharacterized protein n=1 Tax=Cichorium intybus TaxID=13427 RepID=A0ACB9DT03_CICIN|nr:hypothetical protein L2E82_20184 [Cichorium intybus]